MSLTRPIAILSILTKMRMENIIIRKAREEEFEAVRQFYHAVTDDMRSYDYDIGWEKDVYPSPAFLSAAISNGELLSPWSMKKLWLPWW